MISDDAFKEVEGVGGGASTAAVATLPYMSVLVWKGSQIESLPAVCVS
jgi:hypothetical protein